MLVQLTRNSIEQIRDALNIHVVVSRREGRKEEEPNVAAMYIMYQYPMFAVSKFYVVCLDAVRTSHIGGDCLVVPSPNTFYFFGSIGGPSRPAVLKRHHRETNSCKVRAVSFLHSLRLYIMIHLSYCI